MKRTRVFGHMLALTLTLAGLSLAGTAPNSLFQEVGKRGGTLTLAVSSSPLSFNYFAVIDGTTQTVLNQVFDRLLTLDPYSNALAPNLAESWSFSSDGLVVTLNLRKNVKWSDGVPFTADDVIFTANELANNEKLRANFIAQLQVAGKSLRFSKVNDTTVRINLPTQYGAVLQALTFFPILPKHKLDKFSPLEKPDEFSRVWATNTDLKDIVGTGPFMLSSFQPDQKITLVRNPNSWRTDTKGNQVPYVDRLEYVVIKSPELQIAQFRAGQLDLITLTGAQYPDMKQAEQNGATFRVLKGVGLNSPPWHWSFNFDAKDADLRRVFRDLRFREAMQSALNRQRIIDTVFNGLASLPGHGVAPISEWYVDTKKYLGDFDLKAAAAKLDAMGLRDTDGDGVRNITANHELEFTITHASDSSVVPSMAAIIQNDLKQIGVKVNLQGITSNTVLPTGTSGNFESLLLAFGDQPDPQLRKDIWQPGTSLHYWHRSTGIPGEAPNFAAMMPWERRIYDIFVEAEKLSDQAKRRALYQGWQTLMAKNLPVIMIVKPDVIQAGHARLGNFFVKNNRVLSSNFSVFER